MSGTENSAMDSVSLVVFIAARCMVGDFFSPEIENPTCLPRED